MLKNKISAVVERLKLDLKSKVVLTEAATGAYVVTPIIAALAGAKVFAFTKNTKYGSLEEARNLTLNLAKQFDEISAIEIVDRLTPEIISAADIITNSGHLRPLDNQLLQNVRSDAVIPLMYEAWEWRDADLNLNFCKTKNIKVGATNERHPDVDVFNYLGDMAVKMIFDSGVCLYKNNFILICNNDFGPFIARVLSKVCGSLAVCDIAENKVKYMGMQIDWIGDFPEFSVPEKYKKCDAIIFTAYPFDKNWIGEKNEPILIAKLRSEIENPFILRFAGDIDEPVCRSQMRIYPAHVHSGHMGILPSAIGYDPIICLQSGGLKVGELMLKNETHYKNHLLVQYL